jgi:osmotically inducible lipoprotein OsmB
MSNRAILRFSDAGPYAPLKELSMTSRLITVSATLALLLSVAACGNMSRRDQNTATGAAIGGVAGAVLTGGSGVGTVGGAAVGGVIGHEIDPKKDRK